MDGLTTQRTSAAARANQTPSRPDGDANQKPGSTAFKSGSPLIGPTGAYPE